MFKARIKGFTILELIMVIALIAIVSAIAAPMLLRGSNPVAAGALARKVRDDIRYAQSLAFLRSNLDTPNVTNPVFMYRMRFNVADPNCPGANQYTIVYDANGNGAWGENPNGGGVVESAKDPATGKDYFCVQLDSGAYAGFTISANFGGTTPGVLQFDTNGIPYDSDNVMLTAPKTVTVAKGTDSVTLTVTPNTGAVIMQ